MRLLVPGNLLITGEYLILEEGRSGIVLAPDIFATAEITLDQSLFTLKSKEESTPFPPIEIRSQLEGKEICWPLESNAFLDRIVDFLMKVFPPKKPMIIKMDLSQFSKEARKLGLGSSAATAVLLTAAFARVHLGREPKKNELALPAVEAHRSAQGGRGSGYDVLTSLFGGIGQFKGGEEPSFSPIPAPVNLHFALAFGPEKVSTTSTLGAYQSWKEKHLQAWKEKDKELAAITQLFLSSDWTLALERSRSWGQEMGNLIGVPAVIPHLESETESSLLSYKSLGAGNEIALLWSSIPFEENSDYLPVTTYKGGLTWY